MDYNSAQFIWDMSRHSAQLEDFKEKVTVMLWEAYQDAIFDETDPNANTKLPRPVDLQVAFDFPDDNGRGQAFILQIATDDEPIRLGRFVVDDQGVVPLPPPKDPLRLV